MNIFEVNWLGCCDHCGCNEAKVETESQTNHFLYEQDKVTCSDCGRSGVVTCYDNTVSVSWDEDGDIKLTLEEEYKLKDYAYHECTEIGSYVGCLLELNNYTPDHGMSEEMRKLVNKELKHWLNRFETETTWTEEVVPQPDKVYRTLEWNNG